MSDDAKALFAADQWSTPLSQDVDVKATGIGPNSSFRFRLRTLLLTAAIALICFGAFAVLHSARTKALANHISNNFRWIEIGLHNYSSAHERLAMPNCLDADGAVLSSWRFAIIPYMESLKIKRDHRAAWDDPANSRVRALAHQAYCWTDSPLTSVFAITGGDTAFHESEKFVISDLPPNLMLLAEVHDSNTHWMEPGDYEVSELLAAEGQLGDIVQGLLPDRVHVMFADGEVWALSPETPMASLHPLLTITSAKNADRDEILAPYCVDRRRQNPQ